MTNEKKYNYLFIVSAVAFVLCTISPLKDIALLIGIDDEYWDSMLLISRVFYNKNGIDSDFILFLKNLVVSILINVPAVVCIIATLKKNSTLLVISSSVGIFAFLLEIIGLEQLHAYEYCRDIVMYPDTCVAGIGFIVILIFTIIIMKNSNSENNNIPQHQSSSYATTPTYGTTSQHAPNTENTPVFVPLKNNQESKPQKKFNVSDLIKYKELLDSGALTQEEFNEIKNKILSNSDF